jgi:hypothetical protein
MLCTAALVPVGPAAGVVAPAHGPLALGLEPAYRRAALWRELKAGIQRLAEDKRQLPVRIIDEAQNPPDELIQLACGGVHEQVAAALGCRVKRRRPWRPPKKAEQG